MTDPSRIVVVGFDFSLTSTGFVKLDCLVEEGKQLRIDESYGLIKPKHPDHATDAQKIERLITIRDCVGAVMTQAPGLPDMVALEDYSFNNKQPGHYTGELGGVVRVYLAEHGYRIGSKLLMPAPTQLKKFATGSGSGGEKSVIRSEVVKRWGFDDIKANDDVYDAYVLARICLAVEMYRRGFTTYGLIKPQIEVLKALGAIK